MTNSTIGATTGTFEIEPLGPYSLATAASFEFGPRESEADDGMRLAFAVDNLTDTAGVAIHQDPGGVIRGEVQGSPDTAAVRAQVARILSLDRDAREWPAVGRRDLVVGDLQARYPGFRPVLFHSPYEAAAWSVLYGRKRLEQVRRLRDRVAAEYGATYRIEGVSMAAFPTPERLLEVRTQPWLPDILVERLHRVAHYAIEGRLDTERLRSMDPEAALTDLRTLPGVGPFFAGLILFRAAGLVDEWRRTEELDACIRHFYGADPDAAGVFEALGVPLRPFRTWAAVLLRRSGYGEGVR
jgi:DNA-3-methyladenine glycosylase II